MIQKKYFDFKDSLNENVQQAKVYLKNLALKKKKEASGETDQPIGLSVDEVRLAETNPNFVKIKDMCRDNPGYTYLFTKIFFEEYQEDTDRFEELQNFYNQIKALGNSVKDLPMPLDRYAAIKPTPGDHRPISERIADDIEVLRLDQKLNKFKGELNSSQKRWVEEATKLDKDRLINIANSFYEMGKGDDGVIDTEDQYSLHRVFFSKVKDFTSLSSLIDYATNYIRSVENAQFSKFIAKIDKVNSELGPQNGAKMLYNDGGNLVIQVYSYVANRILNGHTTHCISRNQGHWDSYTDQGINNQYYVYDFNLDPSDPMSVIGLTVRPDGTYADLKNKLNNNVPDFKTMMKDRGVSMSILKPPTAEEIAVKKKRIEASRKIILPNLSVVDLQDCLSNGADPNSRGGQPLKNAVKEDNKEAVKLLISKGALVNATDGGSETAITHAKNLEMLKILVAAGASLNSYVFSNVANDREAVEYLLKAGMDPSFERAKPFRLAAKNGDILTMELLLKYADNIQDEKLSTREKQLMMVTERRYMALKNAAQKLETDIVIFLLDKLVELKDDSMKEPKKIIDAVLDSAKLSDDVEGKLEFTKNINDWYNQKFGGLKESRKFKNFKNFRY